MLSLQSTLCLQRVQLCTCVLLLILYKKVRVAQKLASRLNLSVSVVHRVTIGTLACSDNQIKTHKPLKDKWGIARSFNIP